MIYLFINISLLLPLLFSLYLIFVFFVQTCALMNKGVSEMKVGWQFTSINRNTSHRSLFYLKFSHDTIAWLECIVVIILFLSLYLFSQNVRACFEFQRRHRCRRRFRRCVGVGVVIGAVSVCRRRQSSIQASSLTWPDGEASFPEKRVSPVRIQEVDKLLSFRN